MIYSIRKPNPGWQVVPISSICHKVVTISDTYCIPRFPFLGASPDGCVRGEEAVMEVKCPFSGRRDKIKPGKNFSFLEMMEGDTIQLKRSHKYYYQVGMRLPDWVS